MKRLIISIASLLISFSMFSQLNVNKNLTVTQLVQNVLIGNGVSASNITYSGNISNAYGKFTNGGTTNLGLTSGIIMSTGDVADAPGPNNSGSITTNNNTGSDPDLAALIPGFTINDAATIEFDFVPLGDTVKFQYVFGSDEYPEFVNSSFNDVFGFFISGPNPAGGNYVSQNIAMIPGTTMPVTIDNVNINVNSQYYIDNTTGMTIEYDGMTTVLTAWAVVTPCQTYHFKIAIGDAGDSSYDSAVFLKENSFSTDAVQIQTAYSVPNAGQNAIEGCNNVIIKATLPEIKAADYVVYIDTMWGTATNGVDFPAVADSFVIAQGSLTDSIVFAPIIDYVNEGTEQYNIIMQTSICTVDTIQIPIVDYVPISLTTSPDTLICEDSVMLRVNPVDGHLPYTIKWSPAADLNNPNIQYPIGNPGLSTSYVVEVYDSTGCPPVYDTVNVTVSPKPLASFSLDPFNGCEPLVVNFNNSTTPDTANINYLWEFGDNTTSSQKSPTHTYMEGVYDIAMYATTDDNCIDSIKFQDLVTAYPQPKASFDAEPDVTSKDNPDISFIDLTTNPSSWEWNFGDGGTSTEQNPDHTYSSDNIGSYEVRLIAYNQYGCADTAYKTVEIVVDEIVIPNIITPNGDGKNDAFVIKDIEFMLSSKLVIYNRWGKKVFEATNYNQDNAWDADNLADGVYYYVLEYETYFELKNTSGSITVLRK